ncbi:hypothetical protein [Caulobacter sp. BK020]|uniref:hypothetical protein n=1 Tax=Caulobacter sp. BK020 TaxID=2512117 RepID=UPI001050C414|nr:hypothetical protein [Caulobacter sp. BK020]TCS12709.1 hypothetical protein EV278_112134 [Caulobacter sp. BK020]
MTKSWLAAALATTLIAPGALAAPDDDFQKTRTEAVEISVGQRQPFGGLDTMAARTGSWSVNTFYVDWTGTDSSRTAYWIVRRVTGSRLKAPIVQWADSRSCPAVRSILEGLQGLRAPRPDVPGVGAPRELSVVADGESHDLWLNWAIYPNDARGDLRMEGNVGSPVGDWWDAALPKLEVCWTGKIPA